MVKVRLVEATIDRGRLVKKFDHQQVDRLYLEDSGGDNLQNVLKPDQPNRCIRPTFTGISINRHFDQCVSFDLCVYFILNGDAHYSRARKPVLLKKASRSLNRSLKTGLFVR